MKILLIVLLVLSPSFRNFQGSPKAETDLWPYSAEVVYPPTGTGSYIVCVDEAEVRGGPDANRVVHYTLPRGTEVNVRERAKWTEEGWAMIEPAYWVRATDLCEK